MWRNAGVSWGLGVVLPNGAELANGKQLSWAEANNVTSVVKLPNITEPDGVTYLVLSAKGNNGAIFQVAAGIWPGSNSWSAYSWYITGADANTPSYSWVMNSSAPTMTAGDALSLSISVGTGAWGLKVQDLNSGGSKALSAPSPGLTGFASGDQEVLALESYSRSASTFRGMGNASLLEVLVNGNKVTGGWYAYGGWDPAYDPLFVVGNSQPPAFVSLTMTGNGQAVWGYQAQWTGEVLTMNFKPVVLAYASLAALVPIALVVGTRTGHRREERT
jgi:hypothetical protein